MRIVCISDTHGRESKFSIPEGDMLLHAGDLCSGRGTLTEAASVAEWLRSLPHRHKVVIAGNHDFCFQQQSQAARALMYGLHYLEDEALTIEGLRLYGSPWQPWFCNWAFNLRRGEPLRRIWAQVPEDTDILITHGPPKGLLDRTSDGHPAGCEELLARVETIRPGLHLFGHIHEGYGSVQGEHTLFLNASVCNLAYQPIQAPWVVDWDPSTRRFRLHESPS